MVGRAPKKRRMDASDQIPRPQSSVPPSVTFHQSGPQSGSSPQPVLSVSMPGNPPPAVNNIGVDGPDFAMGEFNDSPETDINSYLQNLLTEYPDLPLVPPGATNSLWLGTENLLPNSHPEIHEISISDGTSAAPDPLQTSLASSHTSGMSDKHSPGFLQGRTAESVRSRLAEHTEARVPSSYRDRSVVSQYPHAAALMRIIECLEEQLQIPRVLIDQAMRLNRQAMVKVREVSKTDEFRRCQSCPLLVATVMDLAVGLYELVILSIQRPAGEGDTVPLPDQNNVPWQQSPFQQPAGMGEMPSGGSSPVSAISGGSEPPLFQFGCLEFDPDEQEIFRAAMVRRDLRRCVETIQYCSQEILQRPRQGGNLHGGPLSRGVLQSRTPSNHAHTQWYQEMGYRAKALMAALPAQCSHK